MSADKWRERVNLVDAVTKFSPELLTDESAAFNRMTTSHDLAQRADATAAFLAACFYRPPTAPECIQAEELTREVEARWGHSLSVSDPEFIVDGVLERRGTSDWMATLMILDARGTVLGRRELSTRGPDPGGRRHAVSSREPMRWLESDSDASPELRELLGGGHRDGQGA